MLISARALLHTTKTMGKRNFRKNNKGKKFGQRSNTDTRGDSWSELVKENPKWEKYYKEMNIIPPEEWDDFKSHCQQHLPLTFRITGSRAHAQEINNNFIKNHVANLQDEEFEGQKLAPKNLGYYPNKLGWQLDVPKTVIRKNEKFAATQRFLVLETEVGNISRQEAVSMIPPLLMDIKSHHAVLDMCAAPGSKTAQLVEALHANEGEPTGFVLANDSDYKRSHMLVHQVKRLNSPNFVVVNHDAQLFPRIKFDGAAEFLKFDRILCDVPCSGDGTMRKNVNVWKDFTVGNAIGLHPLQVNILNRGLQLLKKGGKLVYATCSLSPVENEAVIASALRKWGKQIRVVNCDNELPGLIRRQGISNWKVFGKDMEEREKGCDDVPETAFPPTEEEAKEFNLENCIRVYPHLQNTGGFFITVFEKVDPEANTKNASEEGPAVKKQKIEPVSTEDTEEAPKKKERLPRDSNEEPFIFLDPKNEELEKCWPFYGFSDRFPKDCTLVRNATGEPLRTIYYVSPIVKQLLTIQDQKLKLIHGGVKLFVAQRNDSGTCAWRVQNESLHTINPYLTENRKVSCSLTLLELLFQEAFPKFSYIKEKNIDPHFVDKLEQFSEGCVFLTVKRGGDLEDLFLPLWRGKTNVNLMVNKKDTQELLYRVFNIATTSKDEGKEALYQKKLEENKKSREATTEPTTTEEPSEEPAAEQPATEEPTEEK